MMLGQEFRLENWNWKVRAFYVVDYTPIDFIVEELRGIKCSEDDINEAVTTLNSGDDNRGITFSNNEDRETIMVIGETSCPAQFQNSYDHEKLHLTMHIAQEDHIDPFGEELTYLAGEIGLQTFPVAKLFLCEHCRKELY